MHLSSLFPVYLPPPLPIAYCDAKEVCFLMHVLCLMLKKIQSLNEGFLSFIAFFFSSS